jgi:hypothetical protein
MKNFSLSAMSTESLKVLLQSNKPGLRALAASILSARMVEVEVEGFGERKELPKMGENPASRVNEPL